MATEPLCDKRQPQGLNTVSKHDLGTKRDCPECGARFYDLNKEPAHCPKCEHEFVPEALLKPRKPRAEAPEEEKKTEEEKPEAETSLDDADQENKAAESTRKAGLDEENDDDSDNEEIDEIKDLGIDLDDDDDEEETDDTLLVNDDDADDGVTSIIRNKGDDETM